MNAPRDAFSPSDVLTTPPSIPTRNWHSAIVLSIGGAMVSFAGVAVLLWQPVPLLGDQPIGTMTSHLMAWAKTAVYALSGTFLYQPAVHAYWDQIANISRSAPGTLWRVGSRFGLCFFSAIFAGAMLLRAGLKPRSAEQHLAGARLLVGEDAVVAALREAAQHRGKQPGFLKLHPALDLPKSRWTRHMLITGSVGSGKSQIILPLVEQIVASNYKAIIVDLKGEFTVTFPKCVLLNPFDARSAIWDIGADVLSRDDAAVLAASLIPGNDKNPFFYTSAQMLLTGVVWSLQTERGRRWGWCHLAERAALPVVELEALLKMHYPAAAAFLNPQARSAGDVHSTLLSATRLLRSFAAAWGHTQTADGKPRRRVSLRAWMRDEYRSRARQLILGNGPNPQLTSAYVSAMMNVLVPHVVSPALSDDPARSLFFVLDELPALGKINLPPLIDRGRSKGVICILGLQDSAQLKLVYGAELAQAIPSMIANHVVCQISPGESRDALAAKIGKRRVAVYETTTTAQGGSQRIVEHHDRPILLASDLTDGLGPQYGKKYKPNGFAIRALVMVGGDVLRLDFPGVVLPSRRRSFVPAQWLAPVVLEIEPAAMAAPSAERAPAASTPTPVSPARSELLRLADRLDAVPRTVAEPENVDDPGN